MIRAARHTLTHELRRGALLDFHQFGSTLSTVASILNSRPLLVRTTPNGDFIAIAPRDVLLGRAGKSQRRLEQELEQLNGFEDDQSLERVDSDQAKIVDVWREKWIAQVFPDLVHRQKWKQSHHNLQVGDIGLIKYEKKMGPDAWRLAKIVKADPSDDGRVRTIRVEFRPCHVKDFGKPYKSKQPIFMDIGVQRFAVMLPRDEQLHHGDNPVEIQEQEDEDSPDQSEMT